MTEPPAVPRPDPGAEWYRRRRAEKDGLPLPDGFLLLYDGDSVTIRFPVSLWPDAVPRIPMLLVYLHGNACIAAYALLHAFDAMTWGRMVGVAVALAAIPLAMSFGLRRSVSVLAEGIEVAWWPLPLFARRLVHHGIRQAFVVRRGGGAVSYRQGTFSSEIGVDVLPGSPDRMGREKLDLWVLRADGTREILVGSLRSAEHALFLERWLERRLGIEDAPVDGEAFGGGEAAVRERASGGAEGS